MMTNPLKAIAHFAHLAQRVFTLTKSHLSYFMNRFLTKLVTVILQETLIRRECTQVIIFPLRVRFPSAHACLIYVS